ncbi:MAG: phosphatase PAP2 family protein [Clostridia bacterium]|nr:phosphatase PAP2 family protein [Clostridia bacterium]
MNIQNEKIRNLIAWYRKFIPDYAHLPLILCFFTNLFAFTIPRIVNVPTVIDLSIAFDAKIPLIPATSYIYIGAFAYWALSYIAVSRRGRKLTWRIFWADAIGKLVAFICFMLIPCHIVQPETSEITGVGAWLLKLVYFFDEPNNLFPSIHCFVSWMCFRALIDKEVHGIPLYVKILSFVFTMLICISTLTTKQHVFADTFTGVILAEAGWILSKFIVKRVQES